MLRFELINALIKKINAKKYLEIGVYDGLNLRSVNCETKVGVDPDVSSQATIHKTSDDFFKDNKEKFDVIFIDGLHHAEQVYKDIINSLNILNDNGYIVCHDMNPQKEEHQTIPYRGGLWNGDCWKAYVRIRSERKDLEMLVIDADHGCGVIRRGNQELLKIKEELNWENFKKNRKEWLNLISINNFCEKFLEIKNSVNEKELDHLLKNYISNPESASNNYNLGFFYENIGQTASALSYYLRAAERTCDPLLQYECLLRSSICFDKQGARNFTVKGLLQHALALQPTRPEGYYLLSKFYEKENKDGSWHDCYTIASIGCKVAQIKNKPLKNDVDYPGYYGILFQKGISAWWCGLCEESRDILKDLYLNYNLNENFKQAVQNNLHFLKVELNV